MSLDEDLAKAKAAEQKALSKLNQGESWIARHPGITLAIGAVLLLGDILLAFKAYA